MFEIIYTAQERYLEYLRTKDLIREAKRNANRVWGIFLDNDARSFIGLYRARAKKLHLEMKEECYRCFGTGSPFAHMEDSSLSDEFCPHCFRRNTNC